MGWNAFAFARKRLLPVTDVEEQGTTGGFRAGTLSADAFSEAVVKVISPSSGSTPCSKEFSASEVVEVPEGFRGTLRERRMPTPTAPVEDPTADNEGREEDEGRLLLIYKFESKPNVIGI